MFFFHIKFVAALLREISEHLVLEPILAAKVYPFFVRSVTQTFNCLVRKKAW